MDMTTEQVKQVVDILVDHGCLSIFYTGGEVLCRKDFAELYVYARKKGLLVSVLSNITMLTEEHIKLFTYAVGFILCRAAKAQTIAFSSGFSDTHKL